MITLEGKQAQQPLSLIHKTMLWIKRDHGCEYAW
jgi:hypothetical protein